MVDELRAAPLTLLSSMAVRDVLADLSARYQRVTAQPVVTRVAGGVDVAKRVRSGEAVDVVVLARASVDQLIGDGRLLSGSCVDLVASGIAIAVQAGAHRPDVGSEQAVKSAVQAARTLSYSTGPSGVYLETLFARWGILQAIRARVLVPAPGVPVGSLVASGAAELGFQQLSELLNLEGVDVLGPLPASIQRITVFSGGVSSGCTRPAAAQALLRFMASPDVAQSKRQHGMHPV